MFRRVLLTNFVALVTLTGAQGSVRHTVLTPNGELADRVTAIEIWSPQKKTGRLPLLLFSPGFGNRVRDYSVQLRQIAESGYVVAGVDHAADDLGSLESRARLWGDDIVAAKNWLLTSSVTRRLDVSQVGAFGHSLGGRAAAVACQSDAQIRACLNQDGQADEVRLQRPYWPITGRTYTGAFAFLDWFDPGLTEEDLRFAKTTKEKYALLRLKPEGAALNAYLAAKGGAYRITLLAAGMRHTAFSDIPLRNARTQAERRQLRNLLRMISVETRAFFDEVLKQKSGSLPCGVTRPGVLVQCFRPDRAAEKPSE